ncbi:uncharacterized protein ELE39_002639 [Cryptosporidium sp. chipmunk genotype I]|uniref:uncharacterized protein n=1 Tax=Cryptosporidium sp. chipmunk genotype I TaxID=1280935 RepID=UPI003519E764|nr:hypothetical protein ELE39_002639 [Cryptosporidium sp. chipmunk genotype I]
MTGFYNAFDRFENSTDFSILGNYSNEFSYTEINSAIRKTQCFDEIEKYRNLNHPEKMINNFQKSTESSDNFGILRISNIIYKDKQRSCSTPNDSPYLVNQFSPSNQVDSKSEYISLNFENSPFQNQDNEIDQNLSLDTNKYKYLIFRERYHNGNYYDKYGRFCGFFNNGIFHSFYYYYQQYSNLIKFFDGVNNSYNDYFSFLKVNENETYFSSIKSENTLDQVHDYNSNHNYQENKSNPELEYGFKINCSDKSKKPKDILDIEGSTLKQYKQIPRGEETLISQVKQYLNTTEQEVFESENLECFSCDPDSNLEYLIKNKKGHEQTQKIKSLFQIISIEELKGIYWIVIQFFYHNNINHYYEKVVTETPLLYSILYSNKEEINEINFTSENYGKEQKVNENGEEQQNKVIISQSEFVENNNYQFEYNKLINEIGEIPEDEKPCIEEIDQDLEKLKDEKLREREKEHSNVQILKFENILDFDFEDDEIECIGIKKIKLI